MKQIGLTIAVLLLTGHAGNVLPADMDAGEKLFQTRGCVGCHGPNGISPEGTSYPNLAGQKEAYLVKALKAYRDKVRQDPLMNGIAAGLSDADIANLAAYHASLKPCP